MKKRILSVIFAFLLTVAMIAPAFAAESGYNLFSGGEITGNGLRLSDDADLFTNQEEKTLSAKLNELSEKYNVDFVVATVASVGSYSATDYAEGYYDAGCYGMGEDKSGILLFIAMNDGLGGRAYRIHTRGLAERAMSEGQQVSMGEDVAYYLTEGDYVEAVNVFAEKSEYYINGEINGYPFNFGKSLLISLVIGLVISLIVTGIWRAQLKTVRKQAGASSYTKENSMQVTTAHDLFLYRTVSRVKREKSSSGGGSSGGGRTTGGSF